MKGQYYLMDSKVARTSKLYAEEADMSIDEAMQIFIDSATYAALLDQETGVCLESFESIYDMFLRELRGEEWE
jgi:hypothetical protein